MGIAGFRLSKFRLFFLLAIFRKVIFCASLTGFFFFSTGYRSVSAGFKQGKRGSAVWGQVCGVIKPNR